jgi:hypothetical protein
MHFEADSICKQADNGSMGTENSGNNWNSKALSRVTTTNKNDTSELLYIAVFHAIDHHQLDWRKSRVGFF